MNKSASLTLALTLCALLLSGSGLHIRPSLGLSGINYEHPEKYTVGGAAFTDKVEQVEVHWLSGSFSSALACKTENSRRIFGNGSGDYSIDTTSGSVRIEKK